MTASADDRVFDPIPEHLVHLNTEHLKTEAAWAARIEDQARALLEKNPGDAAVIAYHADTLQTRRAMEAELARRPEKE